jgi:hypothetical protein
LRTDLFWAIRQLVVVIPDGCFGTTYRFLLQGSRIQETFLKSENSTSFPLCCSVIPRDLRANSDYEDRWSKSDTTVNTLLLGSFIHKAYLRNNYMFRPFFLGHRQVDRVSYSRQLYNAISSLVSNEMSCFIDKISCSFEY